jgi:hypothetical protein
MTYRRRIWAMGTLVSVVALCGPALADTAQSVALHCVRNSPVPTQADASWVKSIDLAVDLTNRIVDKTTVLNNGERHDTFKNGETSANDIYTRKSVVIVEPDVVRFGYDVAPKDGSADYRILSTVDRITGEAVDNLSTFVCRLKANPRLF